MANNGTEWTPEEDALLKQYALNGATARQAADALTDRTRNMVIGRANRRGIRFDPSPALWAQLNAEAVAKREERRAAA